MIKEEPKQKKRQNRSKRKTWLKQLTRCEMNRRRPPKTFSEKLGLNVPSWKAIIFVAIILAVSVLMSVVLSAILPGLLFVKTADSLREYYLTMWQVQVAIAGVALPLLIVVIEFSKDQRQAAARRPEALIRDTRVFPTIAFALAGTVRLGIDLSLFFNESVFWFDFVIVFVGTIIFTIIVYMRMLLILFSPLKMQISSLNLIQSQMDKQLDGTIEQRVANNILLKKLKELGLELWLLPPDIDKEEQYIILRFQGTGIVSDINLSGLERFIKRLPRLKTENQAVLRNGDELDKGKSLHEQAPRQNIWWMKQYGSLITNQNNGIIRLDKSQFDTSNSSDLEAQLSKIISVLKEDKGNELRLELSYIRDSLMDSIRDCKTGAVQESLEIYKELVTTFLDKLQQWEAVYNREQAIRETNSLRGGWGEIEWISDDLREIIDRALKEEYTGVLQEVLYFPIKLASLAFQRRDYYIFHQFLRWVPYYYYSAFNMKDRRAKEFVLTRCSMYPADTLRYLVIPDIERSKNEKEIDNCSDFAREIILVFNSLLKSAYDKKDVAQFKGFSDTISSTFESYFRHHQGHEVTGIEFQLKYSTTETQKAKLDRQLAIEKAHLQVVKRLDEAIQTIHYGLHAWVLHEYISDKIDSNNFKQWHEVFPRLDNLENCWAAFSLASKQGNKDDYGWSFWESEEHIPRYSSSRGGAFWGGFDIYLQRLFCIQCLKKIGATTPEQQSNATMPHSIDILSLAENENSPLRGFLKQIEQNGAKWIPIVEEDGIKAIPAFIRILDKAIQAQKDEENKAIKNAELSIQRIRLVKQEIIDTWNENEGFRKIVNDYGNNDFVDEPSSKINFLGFNRLEPKDIFVDNTSVTIEGEGSQIGRGIASGEDKAFIESCLKTLSYLDGTDVGQQITSILIQALDKLIKSNYSPVILILNSWRCFATIGESEDFKRGENQSGHGLVGYFRNRPVFNLRYQGDPYIIIVDLKKFCIWRQFKPYQQILGEEYISKELSFMVKPITEEYAKELVQKNKTLLLDKDGYLRPEAEVISELQLQVHFRLIEQFELEMKDKASGYKISIKR